MTSIVFLRLLSVVAVALLTASFASANNSGCEVSIDDGDYVIMMGMGESKEYPTLKKVFDSMQDDAFQLDDLRYNRESKTAAKDATAVYLKTGTGDEVRVNFVSVPSPGVNSPRCTNKKITGYECYLQDLKKKHAPISLPKGLSTPVIIKVPEEQTDRLQRITRALGCDKPVTESGAPALPERGKQAPIQLLPSGGSTKH